VVCDENSKDLIRGVEVLEDKTKEEQLKEDLEESLDEYEIEDLKHVYINRVGTMAILFPYTFTGFEHQQ